MFIPGWVISLATFPGVVVHEAAHRLFCDLAKVPVYEVCYFRIGNPAGYVVHGEVNRLRDALLISAGPLVINTILCAILTYQQSLALFILKESPSHFTTVFLAWIGYSIGMHAFPSNQDVKGFISEFKKIRKGRTQNILYFISQIFGFLIVVANFLRVAWFDLIYAVGVSMVIPLLLGNI